MDHRQTHAQRTYVITGGAGGIGGCTAQMLKFAGARVINVDVRLRI